MTARCGQHPVNGPVTLDERIAWARAALVHACACAMQYPNDPAYRAARLARENELQYLLTMQQLRDAAH